ncbi:MAG: peptide-binding protein [Deltaproteobacteria bacterium]|nr:peptide-binding protein [Deltaproteobacteria bacterium]
MRRALLLLVGFAVLAGDIGLLAGCAGEKKGGAGKGAAGASGPPAYGDALVDGSIGDVSGFVSAVTSDQPSHAAAGFVFNGLVRYDKNLQLEGELAESWEVSKDGKKITFHLRENVKWHDGAPFSSGDVLFTYRKMIDPRTPTAYAEDFKQVSRVLAPDPYTFIAEYDKPFAPALASWGMHILPKHLLEEYPDISKSPLNKKPVGTGPYRFLEWKTGEKVVFEENPDYFEGRPYISRVVIRVIPDPATMFLELKSGGIDYMGLTPLQFTRQTETPEFKNSFNKYRYLSFGYTYLGFRLSHPFFSDKRVRQAIAHAVNKKEIIDGVLFGLGHEATGPYKPGTWAYNPNVKKFAYDPAKAKAILGEAGWKPGRDGILAKDGRKFAFTVLTNAGNESRAKTAAIIQQNLAAVGIKMEIRTVEWAAFINEFVKKRKFDALILGWTIPQDPDLFDIWNSAKTGPDELNHIGYANAEVDRLLEKGRRTFDMEQRKKAYFRIQEILADEQPIVFLYVPDALQAIHKRFHGIEPAPAGIDYNFIKWYVPKGEQKYTTFR